MGVGGTATTWSMGRLLKRRASIALARIDNLAFLVDLVEQAAVGKVGLL